MKIFVDRICTSSDYDDESKWVDYALLTHFINTSNIIPINQKVSTVKI